MAALVLEILLADSMSLKTCTVCHNRKPRTEFYMDSGQCKTCFTIVSTERRVRHQNPGLLDGKREYLRKWRLEHRKPDKVTCDNCGKKFPIGALKPVGNFDARKVCFGCGIKLETMCLNISEVHK